MDLEIETLERKGRKEPFGPVLEQGKVTFERAKAHFPKLQSRGYRQEQLDDFGARLDEASGLITSAEAKREASKALTRAENQAVTDAKGLIRDVQISAPLAIRDAGTKEITVEVFFADEKLNRSPRKIILHLDRIAQPVTRLEPFFKPYLGVESPSAHLASVRKALFDANAVQEIAFGDLPQATRKFYELKGRLLQHIEDVNRIGKLAFAGQADIAGTFNKDILLRGRAGRRGDGEQSQTPDAASTGF